jgi:RNA polymerase sigma-70 factor (ECF subfamily)
MPLIMSEEWQLSNISIQRDLQTGAMSTAVLGGESLITELYRAHNVWLFGWLRKKLGCGSDAEDLTHDTFCRIMQKGDIGDIHEPRAYLTTTATRLMIDLVRRRNIEQVYLEALALVQTEAYDHSPEHYREAVETLNAIAQMLEGVPEKARRAFLLSRLENMAYAEIAMSMNISVSMVKKYIAQVMVHCCMASYAQS